jgi:hypothetical protein
LNHKLLLQDVRFQLTLLTGCRFLQTADRVYTDMSFAGTLAINCYIDCSDDVVDERWWKISFQYERIDMFSNEIHQSHAFFS